MLDINKEIKAAMLAKDAVRLASLRAVKTAFMMAETEKGAGNLTAEGQLKIIQKQVKQRKDAATIYQEQGREDLAADELEQITVLEGFLPEPMSDSDLEKAVANIITQVGATSMADMGKVMGMASQQLSGQADGKLIAVKVRQLLT
jgi:uncharacterized protein|tara:strand:- start:233 stop:670 length:438 start_codon:yes stop_codon:yes gene_type:complete